jgi:hypothetical protein
MAEPNPRKRQRASEDDDVHMLLNSMASQQQLIAEQLLQIKSVFMKHPNQIATPVSNTPVEDTTPTPYHVEVVPRRHTFSLSLVKTNLLKDAKKLYSKLYDTTTPTKEGLQKLLKHAQDRLCLLPCV